MSVIRPQNLSEFIGQEKLKERLNLAIEGSKLSGSPLPHTLLSGPSGVGKSSLVPIIAKERGVNFKMVMAPSIESVSDILRIMTKLEKNEIICFDEIHSLCGGPIEEILFSAMENYSIPIKTTASMSGVIEVPLKPFTMIGCTTRAGDLSLPLRGRFGIQHTLDYYSIEELSKIIQFTSGKMGLKMDGDAIIEIAKRSRGTARYSQHLVSRTHDYCRVKNKEANLESILEAMTIDGVDENGLTPIDRRYLYILWHVYSGCPVGISTISMTLGEAKSLIEFEIEPFLSRIELLSFTKQGRTLTERGKLIASSIRL